uniref:Bm981 n=1 Tax=Brugia malayi TaxID=6279 RepID=A0A0J9Y3Y1_BRUMA|nr:Bm981 [Brugia malayi]
MNTLCYICISRREREREREGEGERREGTQKFDKVDSKYGK